MITIKVKHLKAGDILNSGVKILKDPIYYGSHLGKKNQMAVSVEWPGKAPKVVLWGKETTVTVK